MEEQGFYSQGLSSLLNERSRVPLSHLHPFGLPVDVSYPFPAAKHQEKERKSD